MAKKKLTLTVLRPEVSLLPAASIGILVRPYSTEHQMSSKNKAMCPLMKSKKLKKYQIDNKGKTCLEFDF